MKSPRRPDGSTYPALLVSGCIGAGILAASILPDSTLYGWTAGAALGSALSSLRWWPSASHTTAVQRIISSIGLFLMGICTGSVLYITRHIPPDHHLLKTVNHSSFPSDDASMGIRGEIVSFPVSNDRYTRFTVDAEAALFSSGTVPVTGKIRVTLWKPFESSDSNYPAFAYRQDLLLRTDIRGVRPPGNPADFDYKSYLARRGIHFTASISDPDRVKLLRAPTSLAGGTLTKIRTYVHDSIITRIPTRSARAILLALLLGDRSRLDRTVKQQFQHTGLMHLLAISGLHVMMIGLVFYSLLLPLLMRARFTWTAMEWTRSGVTLTILTIYGLITGAPPSVVRALVMTALVLGGVLAQRIYDPLNALGAAAIVLLARNPDQLFDAGFQLSFAAVGGILTITPVLNRVTPHTLDDRPAVYYLKNTLFASVAATLGTMPVTLFHFGQVAFGGLLLNLAAIPVTAVILSGAVTTVLFHGAAPIVSAAVGLTTDRAVHTLLQVAAFGDRTFHWTLLEASVRSPLSIVGLVGGLLALAWWHRPRIRWRCAGLSLLLLTTHLWVKTVRDVHDRDLEVIFFDVGQGDAALLETPSKRHILVDGGNRSSYADEGGWTILPHLRRYGIDRLEAVVISHAHSDHMGGLLTVIREIPVSRVIYNGQQYSSRLFDEMIELTDSLQVELQQVTAGDTLDIDPDVRMQVLAPLSIPPPDMDPNEASVVLRIIYKEISFLFTGDVERHTERLLVRHFPHLLPVDVIKVPHHGSKTSSTTGFVHRATASRHDEHTAIISAGRNNKFGLPDEAPIRRWSVSGARVRSTMDGAIWLRTDGTRLISVPWR